MRETRVLRRHAVLCWVALLALAVGIVGAVPASGADTSPEATGPDQVTTVRTGPGDRSQALESYLTLMAIPSEDSGYRPTEFSPPGVQGPRACPPSRCRDYSVPVPAGVKVSGNKVRVLFPRGYGLKKNRKQRYPVIYVYNGARSPYHRWSVATEFTRLSAPMKAIFVFPEGGIGDEAGMFSDWLDGSFDWETFHTDVLVSWVDRKFRTSGARGTVGASMGGLGAVNYVARHPDVFQSLLTISGSVDTNMMSGNILPPELATSLGLSPPDLRRVWGNPALRQDVWQAHNPVSLAPRLKGAQVLVASGTGYPSTVTEDGEPLHTGYVEQLIWTGHRTFLGALTAADVPYQAWVRVGGIHNWPFFDAPLKWGLPKMVAHLRAIR